MIDLKKAQCDSDAASANVCGGPKHCENRNFDASKKDCQECLLQVENN